MAPGVSDKLAVAGIGLLMLSQNYSFFLAYWDLWSQISADAICSDTSFWLGFDSFVCFYVTVMVCGMMLGGWIDGPKLVWWFFFFAHLVGGLCYTLATIRLGGAIYSADGMACADANLGLRDQTGAVWAVQALFYIPYCLCMAGLFYQVVLKKSGADGADGSDAASSHKLMVGGIGLLMATQNYSFFLTFWDLWSQAGSASACSGTSYWLAFDSFVCFYVTVMVCGMVLGGWIDGSPLVWWLFFFAHLVGGLSYTVATIKLGAAIHSADGKTCAAADTGFGDRSAAVWLVQAVFYLPYCLCMAGLFYQVVVKKLNDRKGSFVRLGNGELYQP